MVVGDVAESVEVNSETPLLSTAEASSARWWTNAVSLELPIFSGNAMEFDAARARHRQQHRHAPAQGAV